MLKYYLKSLILIVLFLIVIGGCADNRNNVLSQLPTPILSTNLSKKSSSSLSNEKSTSYKPPAPLPWSYGSVIAPAEWFPRYEKHSWESIIVHHSASDRGGARTFDVAHRARGWDELGYHFVIGNGTDTPDGYIEVGSRWRKQKHGAHCKTPDNYYNDYGVGICLVGNFDEKSPSPKQMESLRKLVSFLTQRYHIAPYRIYGHGEVRGTSTHCPGQYFPMDTVRYWGSDSPRYPQMWASSTR
jgi:hypothetical protein